MGGLGVVFRCDITVRTAERSNCMRGDEGDFSAKVCVANVALDVAVVDFAINI